MLIGILDRNCTGKSTLASIQAEKLERQRGRPNGVPHDFHAVSGGTDPEELCGRIVSAAKQGQKAR